MIVKNINNYIKTLLNKPTKLEIFQPGIENFGIILKGKSIEKLPLISEKFNDCFIVNNFDKEIEIIGDYLVGKNIVHFTNRSFRTAPLKGINYKRFGIKEIQFYKNSILWDKRSLYIIYLYNLLGLSTVFLPKMLLKNSGSIFGSEFEKKFPSTGLLAIYYALEIIKPKNLYIVGLDFYQSDYLIRREWNTPIEIMRKKMSKTDCSGVVNNWIKNYQKVNFIFGTYFDGFKPQKNLKIF